MTYFTYLAREEQISYIYLDEQKCTVALKILTSFNYVMLTWETMPGPSCIFLSWSGGAWEKVIIDTWFVRGMRLMNHVSIYL